MNTHIYYVCVLSAIGGRFGDIKVRIVHGELQYSKNGLMVIYKQIKVYCLR